MFMCVGVGVFGGNSGLWVWNYMFIRWGGIFLCWGWLCKYFWHLLSGLLILVVIGLPPGCCEFVCVGLPHLFFWESKQVCKCIPGQACGVCLCVRRLSSGEVVLTWRWSSIVLLFFLVTSVSMLQFWCEWVSFCCCTLWWRDIRS